MLCTVWDAMPRIIVLEGVEIYMYFQDHAPPHVHAFHGDDDAAVMIRDGSVIAGSLPSAKAAVVRAYVLAHMDELLERWRSYGGR